MLPTLLLLAMTQELPQPALSTPEIVERMVRADNERMAALSGYTGTRRYHFENKRLNKRAEMTVRMSCDGAGVKTFEIVAETGSETVRKRVLRKMLEAEEEASRKTERQHTRIIPANYDFHLTGMESLEGRNAYVLEIHPKTENKFLVRGRIWVDAEDFAVARVEGSPAKNPSFWIRHVDLVQRYGRTGQFWLPLRNESRAQARIFGLTDVVIEYFNYVTSVREESTQRAASGERGQ